MSLSAGRNPTGLFQLTRTSNHTHEQSAAASTTIHVEGGVTTLNGDPILTQDKLDTYLTEADIPDDAIQLIDADGNDTVLGVLTATYMTATWPDCRLWKHQSLALAHARAAPSQGSTLRA